MKYFWSNYIKLLLFLLMSISSCSSSEDMLNDITDIVGNEFNKGYSSVGNAEGYSWWNFDGKDLKIEATVQANVNMEQILLKSGNVIRSTEEWRLKNFREKITIDNKSEDAFRELVSDFGNGTFYCKLKYYNRGDYINKSVGTLNKSQYLLYFSVFWNNSHYSYHKKISQDQLKRLLPIFKYDDQNNPEIIKKKEEYIIEKVKKINNLNEKYKRKLGEVLDVYETVNSYENKEGFPGKNNVIISSIDMLYDRKLSIINSKNEIISNDEFIGNLIDELNISWMEYTSNMNVKDYIIKTTYGNKGFLGLIDPRYAEEIIDDPELKNKRIKRYLREIKNKEYNNPGLFYRKNPVHFIFYYDGDKLNRSVLFEGGRGRGWNVMYNLKNDIVFDLDSGKCTYGCSNSDGFGSYFFESLDEYLPSGEKWRRIYRGDGEKNVLYFVDKFLIEYFSKNIDGFSYDSNENKIIVFDFANSEKVYENNKYLKFCCPRVNEKFHDKTKDYFDVKIVSKSMNEWIDDPGDL